MGRYSSFWNRYIHIIACGILLCIVVISTITRIDFHHNSSHITKPQTITVRVIERKSDTFGSYYHVWSNGLWKLQYSKYLPIGSLVTIEAQMHPITYEQASFKSSRMLQGDITVLSVATWTTSCDIMCNILKGFVTIRRYVTRTLVRTHCTTAEFLEPLVSAKICSDSGALGVGLLLGGTSLFSEEAKDAFKLTGITHIVAVSGFQIVLIASFVEWLLLQARFSKKIRIALLLMLLGLFTLLVGPEPPILRSLTSFIIYVVVVWGLGRVLPQWKALLLSASLLVLIYPWYIFSISFQLSCAATVGIMATAQFRWKWVQVILQPLYAWLVCFPILQIFTRTFSLSYILSNIVLAFATPIITIGNIVILIPIIDNVVAIPVVWLQYILFEFIGVMQHIPYITIPPIVWYVWYPIIITIYVLCNKICNGEYVDRVLTFFHR